jgi:hypothetical protein
VLAEDLEDIREQRHACAEQYQPGRIERRRKLLMVVRQVAVHEIEARQPNRDVQEEDDPPVEVADDEAAGERAEHRPD